MKAQTLKNRIEKNLFTKSGKLASKYDEVLRLINGSTDTLRPIYWTGSGRHLSLRDNSYNCTNALSLLKIDFETGNDAIKGGKNGYFIRLTAKGNKQVKDYQLYIKKQSAELSAKIEAEKQNRLIDIIIFLSKNKERFEELIEKWEKKGKNRSQAERSAAWSLSGRDGLFSLSGHSVSDIIQAWEIVLEK